MNPSVTLNAPPYTPMSSPMQKTAGSRSISSQMPSRIASRYVTAAIEFLFSIHEKLNLRRIARVRKSVSESVQHRWPPLLSLSRPASPWVCRRETESAWSHRKKRVLLPSVLREREKRRQSHDLARSPFLQNRGDHGSAYP